MQSLPDLSTLSHAQKDELIVALRGQVQSLTAHLAAMQLSIKELQARLSLNRKYSSKPPSTDDMAKPAPKPLRGKSGKTSGGQPGHMGATLCQSVQLDEVITHTDAGVCPACHSGLTHFEVIEQRQVCELREVRAKAIKHVPMRALCSCGVTHTGIWPEKASTLRCNVAREPNQSGGFQSQPKPFRANGAYLRVHANNL